MNIKEYFISFENFIKKINDEDLILQYKILFRRWDGLKIDFDPSEKKAKKPLIKEGELEWEESKYTIQDLLEWNAGYYNHSMVKSKNNSDDQLELLTEIKEKAFYTDWITENQSILDIFFLGEQPMLNVEYFETQTRAAKILADHNNRITGHLIFDEVGTGKTVSALYVVRDIISEKKEEARVLIVCPNNKKIEWQKDIRRQLGLYAHIAEFSEDASEYRDDVKRFYFKCNEPSIFIEGQKQKDKIDELNLWCRKAHKKWDLIVIDEAHQCFDNYTNLTGDKILMLTATPIVINSSSQDGELEVSKVREITDYTRMLYIISGGEKVEIKNLFEKKDVFTQLFREDLNIVSKAREIQFITCQRWKERDKNLTLLSKIKGGMTKLIYEQDDELLLYGIYEKFKTEIEEQGYLLEKEKPQIDNYKFNELAKLLKEKKDNSYIIFFNTKWPADNIYNRLIETLGQDKVIIAKKYGGKECKIYPTDNSVTSANIFDHLQNKIREGKRVIFITTGASGGTGLNLGNFDGVINYELPFTSIELEQRFGRVDRMDNKDDLSKEMVFILNDDENPMLRYSTIKINKTCQYMPIRNTVLFNSDFINANIKSLSDELHKCKLSADQRIILNNFCDMESQISQEDKALLKKLIEHLWKKEFKEHNKSFREDISGVSESMKKFIKFVLENAKDMLVFFRIQSKLYYLENDILHWENLLGKNEDEITDEACSAELVDDFESEMEEYSLDDSKNTLKSKNIFIMGDKENKTEIELSKIIEVYENLKEKVEELKDTSNLQVATGIFYIKDGKYYRQSVSEYRKTFKGEK